MPSFRLRVFRGNKQELFASIAIALVGTLVVLILSPATARESDGSGAIFYEARNASRMAAHFVVALISLFCALNAFVDENNAPRTRLVILAWCAFVGICIFRLSLGFFYWWRLIES